MGAFPENRERPQALLKYGTNNGSLHTMKTTMDKAGRLVVPKAIREAAHLEPGTEVELRVVAGRVEIEPAPLDVTLERRGEVVGAVSRRGQPPLTGSGVEGTVAAFR